MKKRLAKIIAGAMALCLLLSACGTDAADPSANPEGTPSAEDRTLTIGLAADPQTMDPQALLSNATTAVVENMYSKLLGRDDEMKHREGPRHRLLHRRRQPPGPSPCARTPSSTTATR